MFKVATFPTFNIQHSNSRHRFLDGGLNCIYQIGFRQNFCAYLRRRRAASAASASKLSVAVVGSGMEAEPLMLAVPVAWS